MIGDFNAALIDAYRVIADAPRAVARASVYVPSDITWREQFIAMEQQLGDLELATTLARSAFTSQELVARRHPV